MDKEALERWKRENPKLWKKFERAFDKAFIKALLVSGILKTTNIETQ